jgi:hypothetical protein
VKLKKSEIPTNHADEIASLWDLKRRHFFNVSSFFINLSIM